MADIDVARFPDQRLINTVTIASGASLSGGRSLGPTTLMGILLPASFTGTSITFQVSRDGDTWGNLYDNDAEVSHTAAGGIAITVNAFTFTPWSFVKIRSGTAGSPTTEAAPRSIVLVSLPINID